MGEDPVAPSAIRATTAQLDAVETAVVMLGGKVLEDPCRAEQVPNLSSSSYTCGCGGETRIAIPYDGPGKFVTLCAVCDCAYLMQKFQP